MILEPWYWLILCMCLIIAELFVMTFASLLFGIAAIIVAGLAWIFPLSLFLQVIIWLILSVLMVVIWFRFIKPLSLHRTKSGLGGSVIIGETGMIVAKPQPNQSGKIRFSVPLVGATEWACRTLDEQIEVGDRVVVTEVVGNELIVSRAQTLAEIQDSQHRHINHTSD